MDYFAKFKKRIAPPKAPPTSAMQLAKFHKYWEYVHVSKLYYILSGFSKEVFDRPSFRIIKPC